MDIYGLDFKKFKETRKREKRREKEFKKWVKKSEKIQRQLEKNNKQKKILSNTYVVPTKSEILKSLIILCCISIFSGIMSLHVGITMPGDVEMARIFVVIGVIFFVVPIALFIIYKPIDNSLPKSNTCEYKNNSIQAKDYINQQELKNNLLEAEDRNSVTHIEPIKKKINWNEELFITELTKTKKGTEVIPVVKDFLEWGKKKKFLKIWWGSGRITGRFYFKLNNVQFLHVNTSLKMSVYIQILKNIAPFDNLNKFEELLNRMKEIFGNLLNNEVRDKGITLPLKTLSGDKLSKFFSVLDWILNNIESIENKKI